MPERELLDVLVDLGGQREYLDARMASACRNACDVTAAVKQLFAYARWSRTPVISCVDATGSTPQDERPTINGHRGTPEQHKAAFTLLARRSVIHPDNHPCVSLRVFEERQQVILTKTHRDPFTNPKLDRLLTELPARRFVIFGTPVETSLRILALGLLQRSRRVAVVRDACGYWDEDVAAMTMRKLDVKGCEVLTTADFLVEEVRERRGIRNGSSRSVA